MQIGITYDLREDYLALGLGEEETAEFDHPETIEAVEKTLQDLGYTTERIGNLRRLILRLARGKRWDMVFNIAEGLKGFGREAQVPALLDAYEIPYTFSDPLVLSLTLHKGMTKRVIRDLGIPTPDFHVIETEADLDKVDLPYPLFAKPVAEGTVKGINKASRIRSHDELTQVCRVLLAGYEQPVLVERFLPGREFTVGILGTGKDAWAMGNLEVILEGQAEPDAYSFHNKEHWVERVQYRLVNDKMAKEAVEVALAAWRGLGCRDAGRVDLRADANGNPNFIEVNPLAGIRPEYSDLPILAKLAGVSYQNLLGMIMQSAMRRVKSAHTPNESFQRRISSR
jgi:D-alanine-D-alanine ligase